MCCTCKCADFHPIDHSALISRLSCSKHLSTALLGRHLLGIQWEVPHQVHRFPLPLYERSDWNRFGDNRSELSHRMAASDLGYSGDYRIACYGVLGGGHVQEVSFRSAYARHHWLIFHLRHYFIKHLVDVIERNARHKRDIVEQNTGARPTDVHNRPVRSTGVAPRTKLPPSINAIRRIDEAPQPILSTDWHAGRFSSAVFTRMI